MFPIRQMADAGQQGLGRFGSVRGDCPGGLGQPGGAVGREKVAQSLGEVGGRGHRAGGTGGAKAAEGGAMVPGAGAVQDGRAQRGGLHRVAQRAGTGQAATEESDGGEAIPKADLGSTVDDEDLGFRFGFLILCAVGNGPALGLGAVGKGAARSGFSGKTISSSRCD